MPRQDIHRGFWLRSHPLCYAPELPAIDTEHHLYNQRSANHSICTYKSIGKQRASQASWAYRAALISRFISTRSDTSRSCKTAAMMTKPVRLSERVDWIGLDCAVFYDPTNTVQVI